MPRDRTRRPPPRPAPATGPRARTVRWREGLLATALVGAIVAGVFWPVLATRALSLDDDLYVSENALVNRPGLASVAQFFREALDPTTVGGYWMPLSMTSLMLDVAAGGTAEQPAPFHRTSLALHVLATVAVLWLLLLLFGEPVPAALAALAFGLHPLAVEPVAWIGERKTVLAGSLALSAAAAHVAWVRSGRAWRRWAAVGLFALALLAKPTATPLPLLLLALDAWPLRRIGRNAIVEKWPYFALAAVSVAITLVSHARTAGLAAAGGAGAAALPLVAASRIVFYAGKLAWPTPLACVYPDGGPWSWARPGLLGPLALVLAISGLALAWRRRRPAVLATLAWWVIALAPVLGLFSYSWVTLSDKYAYLAIPAAALVLAGALVAAWHAGGGARAASVAAALALLGAEAATARGTIAHWSDSMALWTHAVAVSPGEPGVHLGLGAAYARAQEGPAARAEFERAAELDSTFYLAYVNLSFVAMQMGDLPAAERAIDRALALAPADPEALYQGALVAQLAQRPADAGRMLRAVLAARPFDAQAHASLALVLGAAGRAAAAEGEFRRAVELQPGLPVAEYGLGRALLEREGFTAAARAHLEAALAAMPDAVPVLCALAWGMATSPDPALRDASRALELAAHAGELAGDSLAELLDLRATATAAAGRFADAAELERRAVERARREPGDSLAARYAGRLERFRASRPWIELAR